MERLGKLVKDSLDDIAQFYIDQTNRVDEYRPQSLGGESLTTETLFPDYECDEIITSIVVTGPPAPSFDVYGQTAASPGAGTTVVSVVLPQGIWTVNWEVQVGGTTGATENNNFGLYLNNVLQEQSQNGTTAGTPYPQTPVTVTVPAGGGTLAIKNIAAGTVGSIYEGTLNPAAQTGLPFTLKLGKRAWQLLLPQTGILVIAPVQIKLDRSADRFLVAGSPGDWSFELMGYAETGRRGRI